MPLLGDFLGTLLAELVNARAQADVHAVQVARELYRSNELLRRFPMPRFRVPTIVLRVPCVVKGAAAIEGVEGAIPIGPVAAAPLKAAARRALARELRKAKLTLTPQERAALRDRLSTAANDIASRRAPPALFEAARDMGEASAAALKAVLGQRAPEPADLPFAVLSHLSTWKGPLARLEVAVTAMELKEATHTLQLELTVREDALEWTAIEIGGKTEERLVPE